MHYKVQYGFGQDEYFSVDEVELKKAMQAQLTGAVVVLNEGTLNGERIISIRPDYNRYLGYNRDYVLTGEDYNEIGKKAQESHTRLMEDTKLQLAGKPPIERNKEISAGVKKLADGMKA